MKHGYACQNTLCHRKLAIWLSCIVLLMTCNTLSTDIDQDFADYKREALAPYKTEFEKIKEAHKDDPDLVKFCERIDLIDEITAGLIERFQSIRASSLDNLLNDIVAMPRQAPIAEIQEHTMSAEEMLMEYQDKFSVGLSVPTLTKPEIETLRDYYDVTARTAGRYIAKRGKVIEGIDPVNAIDVLELCLVIPFLHVPDENWSQLEIQYLPKWMKTNENLQKIELFTLRLKRPFTAYKFVASKRPMLGAQNSIAYLNYLKSAARKVINNRDYHAGIHCLRMAIELAETENKHDESLSLGFQLAKVISNAGHLRLAADQMKGLLEKYPKSNRYGEAAMLRMKYLYEVGMYSQILAEAEGYQQDKRCSSYLPQILYISWVTHRREDLSDQADELQKLFLERFADHPLGADMYFASAMTALAASDYDEAARLLEIIQYRYPKSRIIKKTREIQKRISKTLNSNQHNY